MAAANPSQGFNGVLKYGATVQGAVVIAKCKNMTLKIDGDELDISNHDTQGWKEKLRGLKEWSIECDAIYIDGDVAQDDIFDAVVSGDQLYVDYQPLGAGAGKPTFSGPVVIKSYQLASPNNDASAINVSMSGAGILTKGAQA